MSKSFLALVLSVCGAAMSLAQGQTEPLGSPEKLKQALRAEDPAAIRAAFRPLESVASLEEGYRPVLREGMSHADDRVRFASALGLSASGEVSQQVIEEIFRAILSSKPSYEAQPNLIAEWALGKQGKRGLPVIIAALKQESAMLRRCALGAIQRIGPAAREALSLVEPLIQDKDTGIVREAVTAKWHIDGDDPFAVAHLVPLLSEKRERQCNGAVDCLKEMGSGAREAVPKLLEVMKQHKDAAVIDALTDLAAHFPKEIVPVMRSSLADPKLADRVSVALLRIEGPQEILLPHLVRLMNTEGDLPIERHELILFLATYGPKGAPGLPGLVRALENPSGQTRINAAEALGKIGPAAKDAIPALRAVQNDAELGPAARKAMSSILGE